MKFSIIMPTCRPNKAKIEDAVASVREQTEDYELIIIENGSNGSLADSVVAWRNLHIKYFQQDEANVSRARNFGIQNSTGDVICFLDDDDILDKDALSTYRKALEETNADVLFCQIGNYYKREKKPFRCHKVNNEERNAIVRGVFNQRKCQFGIYASTGEIVLRKSLLKEHPISFREDESFEEDQTFAVALLSKISNIAVLEAPVYLYRQEKKEKKKDIGNSIFERYYHHCQIAISENRAVSAQEMNAYIIKTYVKYKSWTRFSDVEADSKRMLGFKSLLQNPNYKALYNIRKFYTVIWLMDMHMECYRFTRWLLEKKGR